MVVVTLLYPYKDGAKFDFDYYLNRHIPLARALLGDELEVTKGLASPTGGPANFMCILRFPVDSVEAFLETMASEGAKLVADIPNYTNVEPILQFDERL